MNAIQPPASMAADHHDAGCEQEAATTFTLRRTGRKAVRFDGWQLIEAIGSAGGRHVWNDLNVYRTVKGCVVVELIARRQAPEHQDLFYVKTFEDMNAAATWLEAYRPANDVPIPAGLGEVDTALPWAVLHAVQLRQTIDRLEADYHAMLSEVFAALDLTDPAEMQACAPRRKPPSKAAA